MKMDVFTSWQKGALLLLTLCCLLGNTELAGRRALGESNAEWTHVCTYHNADKCQQDPSKCNMTEEICPMPSEGARMHCYTARQIYPNNTERLLQGCWTDNLACYDKAECVSDSEVKNVTFCCCTGDYCNKNFSHRPLPKNPKPTEAIGVLTYRSRSQHLPSTVRSKDGRETISQSSSIRFNILVCVLLPMIGLATLIIVGFYLYKRHKQSHRPLPRDDSAGVLVSVTTGGGHFDPNDMTRLMINDTTQMGSKVDLIEIKARGRFGCVWKAHLEGRDVAVKVFPIQDQASFLTERDFYHLPQIGLSENILQFVAAEVRGNNLNTEYWLITEYHENGSLYDYLKGHLVTWPQLIKLAVTMAKGLAFLHEDLAASKLAADKPAIAHRDFKSKNVLVKKDLTVCIADLGLALKFEPGKCVGDVHGQVGTRRYMAPEVLEGAINFNRDAFHRIDMYACGLVLWELASRCKAVDGPVDEHRLPFEEEVGLHPSMDEMQEVVVHSKTRPKMKDMWCKHLGMAGLKDTMEECWDPDPEARLSAGCVEERLTQLAQLDLSTSTTTTAIPPPPTSVPAPPPPPTAVPTVGVVVPNNVVSSSLSSSSSALLPYQRQQTPPPPYQQHHIT